MMVNSPEVPDNHLFKITFNSDPDSVHATSYNLKDSTTGEVLFTSGNVFDGSLNGQVGSGLMPVVSTPATVGDRFHNGILRGKQDHSQA